MLENHCLDIVIICPGMAFDGDTDGPLGGSETACRELAYELQLAGNNVTVFSDCEEPKICKGDVRYMPIDQAQPYCASTPHDVTLVQRQHQIFAQKTNSRLNVLWTHDLGLKRSEQEFRSTLWNIDQVLTVSKWHKEQLQEVYGLPEDLVTAIRNGVNYSLIPQDSDPTKRDPNKLMYCARPERGLDVLLTEIFPALLEKNPDYYLCIASYGNVVPEMAEFYSYINGLCESFGGKVQWLGELSKAELYAQYQSAGCYVYPTPSPTLPNFRETSCITAMECMACGLPFVTSARGGLVETLGDYGVLLEEGEGYAERFVDAVTNIEPRDPVREYGWAPVASSLADTFRKLILDRNICPERLARHLLRYNDVIPCRHLAMREQLPADITQALAEYDLLLQDPGTFYSNLGKEWSDECYAAVPGQLRYSQLESFIKALPPARKKILDYGCSYGGYLIHLANACPDRVFVGFDFDESAIERAQELKAKYAQHGNVVFIHGKDGSAIHGGPFDVAICTEVLEHVAEPWALIDSIEEHLLDNGVMYITVPHGPWELGGDDREHLWHFDAADLRDMLRDKTGVALTSVNYSMHYGPLNVPVGWWVLSYMKTGAPTGRIDIERHLALQRPRQTLSVSMIAGPDTEELIRWTLNSLDYLADQLVVVDCGLSHEAYGILIEYGATIIREKNGEPVDATLPIGERGNPVCPREIGFERCRNMSLPFCEMDWILWIDTDEKLVNTPRIHKYLRENSLNGYGIQQCHFACDTEFEPDKPIRFFRNRNHEGRSMLWYGAIHEHPELELNAGAGPTVIIADGYIAHVGYLHESARQKRFARNYPLLMEDIERYPDRILQKSLLMRDKMILVRDTMNMNGQRIDDIVKQHCRDVISLYQEYFLGKITFAGNDPSKYYSQALELLGEGITGEDAKAAGLPKVLATRHASVEDLIKDIEIRIAEHTKPREDEYY